MSDSDTLNEYDNMASRSSCTINKHICRYAMYVWYMYTACASASSVLKNIDLFIFWEDVLILVLVTY